MIALSMLLGTYNYSYEEFEQVEEDDGIYYLIDADVIETMLKAVFQCQRLTFPFLKIMIRTRKR